MSERKSSPHLYLLTFLIIIVVGVLIPGSSIVVADHTPPPDTVTVVGDLQTELGCDSDWDPTCVDTDLAEQGYGVWREQINVPAGSWQYKVALNDAWDASYPTDNKLLTTVDLTPVRFYYDDKTHAVLDNVNDRVGVATGTLQDELGCPGDWQPDCVNTLLTDVDGDGIYSFVTTDLPVGDYAFKVAVNETWDISYPGSDVPFTVPALGDQLTITWDTSDNSVLADVGPPPPEVASVTIAGDLQTELGCDSDWDPTCAATHLGFDADDDVWQGIFNVPFGAWQYKAALNDAWDVSYPNDNIPLNLELATDVKFYYDHKSHWVTDNVNSVIATAAGSFQDEIGCPGDWSPDCLRSWLQDVDGDDVYHFQTGDIPAGNYEFKVALDEDWTVSHPADNVPFSVPAAGALVTFEYDALGNAVSVVVDTGGVPPEIAALVTDPARDPIQDEVFYFVMPDRFDNGLPSNDTGGIPGDRLDHGFDPADKGFFHGGDLAGLTGQLDYLADMGTTAIWMTPVFKNNPVQGSGLDISAGYHGYWYVDMTQFDPHFGTNAELETLIAEAHARDIDVFFDIITNHTADIIDYQEGTYAYRNKEDYPYKDASGVEFDDRDYLGTGTFPKLDPATSFPYTPLTDTLPKVPSWLNDLTYYHNRGNSSFSGENSLYGDFFGLDDMFTEHPDVVDGMIDIYKGWITDYDIDGFRIDTVKHVNLEFWQEFVPAIVTHAEAQGRTDFFVFGEVFSGNPVLLSHYTSRADFPAVLDFRFQEQVRLYASAGGNSDIMRDLFADDDYFTDADSNVYALPTFLGNHDRGRFGWFLDVDNGGPLSDAEKVARSELATAMMFFSRGVPVIYYGDEQGFVGDGGDKDARQDMMPSQVPSYNDDDLIGTDATTAVANFDQTHPLYTSYSDFAALLAAHPALGTGAQLHRYSLAASGIYAFSRIDRDEQIEYVVAFNNANSAQSAAFNTDSPDTTFTEIYPGGGPSIGSDAGGSVSIDVPAISFVVYRADSGLPPSDAAPGVFFNTLVNDQEVELLTQELDGNAVQDRIEVGVELTESKYAEVTFAVRKTGEVDYTVIGVDDNAPYRVFFSLEDVPGGFIEGDMLDFVAVVRDNDGNLNYAEVTGIKPIEDQPPAAAAGYAIIHYFRADGDYGDHTTGDYNDYWGLHLWGDIDEAIDWTAPKPFLGEDEYGRFAWVKLLESASNVGFIVHRGDTKDGTDQDRFFNPGATPEIWLKNDDATIYTSQAAAQGYATVRYHRDDGDYGTPSPDFNTFWGLHLWGDAIDPSEGTEWSAPKPFDGVDDFGAFWNIQLQDPSQPLNFIIHRGDTKDPGPNQAFIPQEMATVWIMSGDETIYPQQGAAEGTITLHYHRPAGDYGDYTSTDYNDFWGMHTWGDTNDPGWTTPRKAGPLDTFGAVFTVELTGNMQEIGYILHRGDAKDPGTDQALNVGTWGYEVWQLQAEVPEVPNDPQFVYPLLGEPGANPGNINVQSAYWVDEKTILWEVAGDSSLTYKLHYAPTGGLEATEDGVIGGDFILLGPGTVSPEVAAKFPHLAELPALEVAADDLPLVPDILKGQIAVSAVNADGKSVDATGLQIPGVLDDLYTYDGELGVSWEGDVPTIGLWAPTAKSVTFHLFDDADPTTTSATTAMVLDPATGVWAISGAANWKDKYYLYEVEVYVHSTSQVEHNLVTDPYSLSLAMNSTRSQIVDLNDANLKPAGWDNISKPELVAPEDISVYEIHMRDFSVNDPDVPDALKGTFKAFTLDDTAGAEHLRALADAGLSHLHLLPVFDIATINENKAEWQEADWAELATYDPNGEEQQALITQYEDLDGFNWGYDPFHYTTPEGSYSTNPDGPARIIEFREMVQAINEDIGLRVVMDVVYNHTNSAGQDDKSVLDRIVPGYYHRLDANGNVETSTCCQNTATEHNMMEKLMIDSLVVWARDYGVDAFRFDLMGHHSLENMMKVKATLEAIDPDIYIYGEGWNFGEVADNARFVQATQLNLGGTGIGSFSDRLRDAVRGGGPFDSGQDLVRNQGWANGLFYDPNALNASPELEPEPAAVTIAGSLQNELGCSGDWQADCAATHLTYDAADTVWQQTFAVPAGSFEYKATIDDSWDENYGTNAEPNGSNIVLNLGAPTDVKFYYSDATHWVTDNVNAVIATVPGSYQAAIGCPGDWQPDCLRSWLQDPDGDGIYSFSSSDIPPGDYEAKVAINESWDENYGQGGVQNGPNYQFFVEAGQEVLFSYDSVSHVLTISYGSSDQLATLLHLTDQIRVGMAGNLADYQFIDHNGNLVTGAEVDYNGQPAGYTEDPQEDITYISKHDNQTLYDNNTYKIPDGVSMEDRVRIQNVGLSTVLLGQGVPFMHAGSDLLRSKSLDRDSFNSGDWFNKLDFTYQSNNFGVGLPVAGKNQDNWGIMQPFLANPELKADPEDMRINALMFQELLAMRKSSPLFRLQTEQEVMDRVMFHNTGRSQLPGLIVMTISDMVEPDLDADMERIVVLINANDEAQSFTLAGSAGSYLDLHRVQQNSVDPLVRTATFDQASGTFSVPGRTAVVFVEYTPQERIENLIDDVEDLVAAGVLNEGQGNALIVKLEGALDKLNRGNPHVAINRLGAFVNQVYSFVEEGILSPEQGQYLIDQANSIVDQINDLY